ncbi:MmgE/PrpD family protein [Orrella marina]|uniref:MmgE/PrpD family protein n=1 Tax=Orrella marina TaxID=2163011 RepID=A0A2R4XFW6_9BURK|nr:MmgE/PrpD family protein [Orrella marina]AWB32710.1 MmgE/PrpD family protein [Orrella marina]
MSELNASRLIAKFASQLDQRHLTDDLSHQVGRAIIDTVGVGVAGRHEPASLIGMKYARSLPSQEVARAWGERHRLSLHACVLYNGIAAHVLDFDDVNSPLRGHPSIALLPPLLALGEANDLTVSRVAAAYVVGFEVMVRIARAMVQDHYAKGWHATTTLGTIGAAIACSNLLGLTEDQTVNCIGLAVAQAAGTRGNFGTMAKSFQTGQCGVAGMTAALLAQFGMTASDEALDGEQGFTRLYGEYERLDECLAGLESSPHELLNSGIEIKKYPMCYAAHRSLDGILSLVREHRFEAQQVRAIHVTSNYRALVPLIHSRPTTGLEAKFSMEYAMAAAVVDRRMSLASFTDEAVMRPEIQSFLSKVTKAECAGPQTPRWNELTVELVNGQSIRKKITTLHGSMQHPLSDQELKIKWDDCMSFGGFADQGDAFFETALTHSDRTVRELMVLLPCESIQQAV